MKRCIVAIWQGMVDASTLSDEEIDAELERGYADMKEGILEIYNCYLLFENYNSERK